MPKEGTSSCVGKPSTGNSLPTRQLHKEEKRWKNVHGLRKVFSREPRLYKRVCPSVRRSVGRSVRRSVGNHFFRRAETKTANDFFRVYELVFISKDFCLPGLSVLLKKPVFSLKYA